MRIIDLNKASLSMVIFSSSAKVFHVLVDLTKKDFCMLFFYIQGHVLTNNWTCTVEAKDKTKEGPKHCST